MIHLVWSGKGFIVLVVTFCCGLAMEFLVRALYHDEHYYQTRLADLHGVLV